MTEQTPTSSQPDPPPYPVSPLTLEQERILAFLAAYPHASLSEIAFTTSHSAGAALEALNRLMMRGYVKRSTRRFEGWLAVAWMFNPDGDASWPEERGPVADMAQLHEAGPFR